MSCSADYFLVTCSQCGLVGADVYTARTSQQQCTHQREKISIHSTICTVVSVPSEYYSVYSVIHTVLICLCGWHTLPYVSSEPIAHKKLRENIL